MICPKCKTNNSSDEKFCINCGAELVVPNSVKKEDNDPQNIWFKSKNKKAMIIGVCIIAIIVIVLIAVLIIEFSKSESEQKAQILSKTIGHSTDEVLKLSDLNLSDKSTYSGVSDYIKFSYICESSDTVKADGVVMPKWLITVMADNDKVSSVVHYDFTVMEESYKGIETDGEIKLSKFSKGDKFSRVKNEIDIDPYTVEYKGDDTEVYTYKYYFLDTAENEQARALTVEVKDGEYISSKVKTVYPAGL